MISFCDRKGSSWGKRHGNATCCVFLNSYFFKYLSGALTTDFQDPEPFKAIYILYL